MGNREQTKTQLLKTALELFARKGYHGVTTRDVARRARRNEALLFRYFGDKRGLLQAVIDSYRLPSSEPPYDNPASYPVEKFFELLAEDWYRAYAAQPEFFRLMRYCSLEAPEILKGYTNFYRDSRVAPVLTYISQQQQAGVIRDDLMPLTIGLGFMGAFGAWLEVKLWINSTDSNGWKEFRDEWLRLFLDSILVKRNPRRRKPALAQQ